MSNPESASVVPEESKELLDAVEKEILKVLADAGVNVLTHASHEPAHTCETHAAAVDMSAGVAVKNMFLRSKKTHVYYLLCTAANGRPDLQKLNELEGFSKKDQLRMGPPEDLYRLLRVLPGHVSPLSVAFDKEKKVRLLLDKEMVADDSTVLFVHPMRCDATISITVGDLKKFLEFVGVKIHRLVEVDRVE